MSDKLDKSDDNKKKDADSLAEHRMRMRLDWNNLIEDMIQEGLEKGSFDDLSGKGKPLNLKKNPYGAEWELAHHLMKENDVLPPWIAHRNEISAQTEQFRTDAAREWARHEQAFRYAQSKGHKDALSVSWDDVCRQWAAELVALNKQIRDFNLGRPSEGLEIVTVDLRRELKRLGAKRFLN